MEEEQRYVVKAFRENFLRLSDKKIILYGIGKNTRAILGHADGFSFLGLMDPVAVGENVYGHDVLSEEEAMRGYEDDRIIVIVARESVINIIYKRIRHLYEEYKMPIYDYKGNDLNGEGRGFKPLEIAYWNVSYDLLIREIDRHDIISFDIFDTLVMRRTLFPQDVFELIEMSAKELGINIPFCRIRKEAENNIRDRNPSLDDIYREMKSSEGICDADWNTLRAMEERMDREQMIRREAVVSAFRYALEKKKRVYLLSDMYYASPFLEGMLSGMGISGFDGIFVSNEIKCTKEEGGAFDYLKSHVASGGHGSILHIGDNRRADIEQGMRHGVDVFHLYSGYELFMASSMQGLLSNIGDIENRCILGLIAARLFNSPFAVNGTRGAVSIEEFEDLGYCFLGPMLSQFVKWMDRQIQKEEIHQVLFPSRDGMLIKKLYELLSDRAVKNTYFRCSRRSATVASIVGDSDIARIAKRQFRGSFRQLLSERFGIHPSGNGALLDTSVDEMNDEALINALKSYSGLICDNAKKERERYMSYLKGSGGVDFDLLGSTTAAFDFVTSGTTLFHLSLILHAELRGICFATMNLPNDMYGEGCGRIYAAYGNLKSYGCLSALSKHYLTMEAVLTDERDTFRCIAEDGSPVFAGDGFNHKFSEIENIQSGIINFASDYKSLFRDLYDGGAPKLDFADEVFASLFEDVEVADEIKNVFVNDDRYDGVGSYSLWN